MVQLQVVTFSNKNERTELVRSTVRFHVVFPPLYFSLFLVSRRASASYCENFAALPEVFTALVLSSFTNKGAPRHKTRG